MNHRVYRKVLKNKMKVLLVPFDETETIAVGIFIKAGSRYETPDNNGIAHFLEHMMFKGTTHLQTSTISNQLDSVGARYNAETSYEQTNYYIYGHKNDTELFIKLISDLYMNPVFKEEDIKIEKGVVIEELNMAKDDANEQVHEMMFSDIFSNSSLRLPIIGTKNNILNYTRKDIVDFRKKLYIPERTVFVVSGNFNKQKIYNLIKSLFRKQKNGHTENEQMITFPLYDPPIQIKPNLQIKKKKIAQTSLILAFRSHSIYSEREEMYDLIADVLTSGSSSRLFVLLRNKLGAIYFSSAYNMSFTYEGIFAIHIGVDNHRVDEVINKVMDELQSMKKHGITKEELDKAKKIRITAFSLGLQTPQDFLSYYGSQELIYRVGNVPEQMHHKLDIQNHIEYYDKITLEQVNEVIGELFRSENLNIYIYGKSPLKIKK